MPAADIGIQSAERPSFFKRALTRFEPSFNFAALALFLSQKAVDHLKVPEQVGQSLVAVVTVLVAGAVYAFTARRVEPT